MEVDVHGRLDWRLKRVIDLQASEHEVVAPELPVVAVDALGIYDGHVVDEEDVLQGTKGLAQPLQLPDRELEEDQVERRVDALQHVGRALSALLQQAAKSPLQQR